MQHFSIHNLIETINDPRTVWIVLWIGIGILTLSLLVLMRTRWGQAKPLSKCIVLSVAVHILLMGYAQMTQLFIPPVVSQKQDYRVQYSSDAISESEKQDLESSKPWNQPSQREPIQPVTPDLPQHALEEPSPERFQEINPDIPSTGLASDASPSEIWESQVPLEATAASEHLPNPAQLPAEEVENMIPEGPHDDSPPLAQVETLPRNIEQAPSVEQPSPREPVDSHEANAAKVQQLLDVANAEELANAIASPVDIPESSDLAMNQPSNPGNPSDAIEASPIAYAPLTADRIKEIERPGDGQPIPAELLLRGSADRDQFAQRLGGTAETEMAVDAALLWLSTHQEEDGRWDADALGAGRQPLVAGQDRGRAGAQADTGLTALAMLSYLGAGHTHYEGPYRTNIQHGLEYLLRMQAEDGNLAGEASLYARMYCHGMATIAISEAYAMTGDERILPFVKKAVQYTIDSQHPIDGGWRYQPGDRGGDMSQCGWQLMALKSASMAGVEIPSRSFDRVHTFIENSASGEANGLASYRPGERVSATMTAESLACQIFLDIHESGSTEEAVDYILRDLPDSGSANFYYWYYASIALFQLQGEAWKEWNDALQPALLARQRQEGDNAGSWDPDTLWGPHGGRVYSTAMACLCLEVYYRYLPLYLAEPEEINMADVPGDISR